MSNPDECTVCFTSFSQKSHRPRTLPCGHTFCSSCIAGLLNDSGLACPDCRAHHPAPDENYFPINYSMEALIQRLQRVAVGGATGNAVLELTVEEESQQEESEEGISELVRSGLTVHKGRVASLLTACQDVQSQLDEYKLQLSGQRRQHLQLLARLCGLVQENRMAVTQLEEEEERVCGLGEDGDSGKEKLRGALERLDSATTVQEGAAAQDHATSCTITAEMWLQRCQELCSNDRLLNTSCKVLSHSQKSLTPVSPEGGASAPPTDWSAVQERVQSIVGQTLSIEELRILRPAVRTLVEEGRVFAVHMQEADLRSSRVTLEDGLLHIYSLLDQPPPAENHTLQVTGYLASMYPTALAFLDLAWSGSTRGRVYIRLFLNTPLARQFLLLCTGQRGHTYANTKLFKVCGKRSRGEFIIGGDYQHNDGSGGTPLLADLRGDYRRTGTAGSVWCRWEVTDDRTAQFAITTRECNGIIPRVFGTVTSGLGLLKMAVNHVESREVTVADCGVVMTL